MNFKNKKILITGATGGIGNALVKKFVDFEGTVLATGTKVEKLNEIKKNFPKVLIRKFDISDHSKIEEFIENSSLEMGGLDILINNAGINVDNLSLRMKDEEWNDILETNLSSAFRVTKACLRGMVRARKGRVINVTSIVGTTGNPGQTNYAAAKAGLVGFTKSLAAEVASRGITVNAIAPGFIETDMTASLEQNQRDALTNAIPLGRLGVGEDVAAAAVFLASPEASYITGQVIHVNGGLYMSS